MKGKELYLLILAVLIREYAWSCLGVLRCGWWILAVYCCGWWVVRRVCCWLWLTWNHFIGECGPGEVEEPYEFLLLIHQVGESCDRGNNHHKF